MPHVPPNLDALFDQLSLSPPVSLDELEQAYFRLRADKIRQNLRQDIPALKQAYQVLKQHLEASSTAAPPHPPAHPSESGAHHARMQVTRNLQQILFDKGIQVQVHPSSQRLQIQLIEVPHAHQQRQQFSLHQRSKIIALVHAGLRQYGASTSHQFQQAQITAYRYSMQVLWTQSIPVPGAEASFADHDFTSFQSRLVQLLGFPTLLILALGMNAVAPVKFLLRGITIWFHEFGHATVAWLAGRRALPLPFGWTNVDPTRSLWVYGGIMILLGLMGWAGYRERRTWPMILAVGLMVLQFWMTWLMPTAMFEMLLSFGGIGGEFYLCTLLIVSFFFPLPDYFRWDIYRYPAVLGAAFTFWGSFWLWQQIDRGQQSIPWGSLWGGADHQGGDMNQLSLVYGWSDRQIIDTYNTLGGFCLGAIAAIYFYFVWKHQRSHLLLFWHQLKASYWN